MLRRKDMQYNTRTHYDWGNNRNGDYNSELKIRKERRWRQAEVKIKAGKVADGTGGHLS